MDVASVVALGLMTLLLWLHAVYFDRVRRWPVPWSRWTVPPGRMMAGTMKVAAYAFAVLFSVMYALWLAAALRGPAPPPAP